MVCCAGGQSAMPEPTRHMATNPRSLGAARTCHSFGYREPGLRVLYDVEIKRKRELEIRAAVIEKLDNK